MWTNQDDMFATPKKRLETDVDIDKKAIQLLDKVACEIADEDVTVSSVQYEPTKLDPFEGGYTAEKLTVEFHD